MIKIEKAETVGWEPALRGMRNPMNSWDKADSYYGCEIDGEDDILRPDLHPIGEKQRCDNCGWCEPLCAERPEKRKFIIGPNDHDLAMRLRNAGTDHRKFMRMIVCYADITAPLYWWKEFDTYRNGVEKNSCSTMHKIAEKEFTLGDFSTDHLISAAREILEDLVDNLNSVRAVYTDFDGCKGRGEVDDELATSKDCWWQLIQLLPSSYNQKRTVMMSYEALANMYHARKSHKLDEWKEFCKWAETLPEAELITGE